MHAHVREPCSFGPAQERHGDDDDDDDVFDDDDGFQSESAERAKHARSWGATSRPRARRP